MRLFLIGLLTAGMCAFSVAADIGENTAADEEILTGRILLPVESMLRQNSYEVLVELRIQDGWHINSNAPLEEFLIPTGITMESVEGLSFGRIEFPEPELKDFAFSETKVSVYEGVIYAKTTVTVSADFPRAEAVLAAGVYYQACNDYSCLAPDEIRITRLTGILPADSTPVPVNQETFQKILPRFETGDASPPRDSFSDVLTESGMFYTFFFIFMGGLALNLTPCVYPLIPITISYFGGQTTGSRGALVLRAVIYVIGMSVTYSILGVVAALTGGILGSALQNPVVLIFVALVLTALALSMFGLYEIRVPQSLAMIGGKNRSGFIGTLLMGLTVGLIAAPCIGPFVIGLLTYVGELGDPFLGFWMFFILAMGLGAPFIVLGIFSGAVTSLPRSGAWMVWVRNAFGFVLIGMAVYFLEPLFPGETVFVMTLAALLIIAGVYLGWIDKNRGAKGFRITRYAIGVLCILAGMIMVLPDRGEAGPTISWQQYTPQVLNEAVRSGQPVIIDFYADWCLPCKELDTFTFSDSRIIDLAGRFVTIKADLTHSDSPETRELKEKFDIRGVPTIVFISESGEELASLRLTGFESPEEFKLRMQQALQTGEERKSLSNDG